MIPLVTTRIRKTANHDQYAPWDRSAIEQSIPERFAQVVARHAMRIAVKTPDATWTYAELDERSDQVAHALLARLGRGHDRIALLLDHGPELIAGLLGVLKAGKAYVALDRTMPWERLRSLVDDAGPHALVTDAAIRGLADSLGIGASPCLDINDAFAVRTSQRLGVQVRPHHAAYLAYTAGSSGNPKGVQQIHRNLLHHVRVWSNQLRISPGDRVTLQAPCRWSAAVLDLFSALLNGATLYPVSMEPQDLARTIDWLITESITIHHSTVPIHRRLMKEMIASQRRLPALRLMILGGGAIHERDLGHFRSVCADGCLLVNAYGATECSAALLHVVGKHQRMAGHILDLGKAVDDIQVILVNGDGERVGDGQAGEIVIRSRFLSSGYWRGAGQPGSSAGSNQIDPGSALYRTGDLGRYTASGNIALLGRIEYQAGGAGRQVGTCEIEALIAQHRGVDDAVVVPVEHADGSRTLTAFIVPATGAECSTLTLREHLAGRLPDQCIPRSFRFLDSLPMLTNGTIDRRISSLLGCRHSEPTRPAPELPAPVRDRSPGIRPWLPLHQQLLDLWQELMPGRTIGMRQDLLASRGDPRLMADLLDRIEQVCGVALNPEVFRQHATIERLAALILEHSTDAQAPLRTVQHGQGIASPIVFLHGDALGAGLYCHGLAKRLGPEWPFFALSPYPIDGGWIPSVEAMAAEHLRLVRSHLPLGPYVIGGFGSAGLPALELARKLRERGQAVDLVVLIDAACPVPAASWMRLAIGWAGTALGWSCELTARRFARAYRALGIARRPALSSLRSMLRSFRDGVSSWLSRRSEDPGAEAEPEGGPAPLATALDSLAPFLWSSAAYAPRRYDAPVLLLVSDEAARDRGAVDLGWGRTLPGLIVERIPGGHLASITTHAGLLAILMRGHLLANAPQERLQIAR